MMILVGIQITHLSFSLLNQTVAAVNAQDVIGLILCYFGKQII